MGTADTGGFMAAGNGQTANGWLCPFRTRPMNVERTR